MFKNPWIATLTPLVIILVAVIGIFLLQPKWENTGPLDENGQLRQEYIDPLGNTTYNATDPASGATNVPKPVGTYINLFGELNTKTPTPAPAQLTHVALIQTLAPEIQGAIKQAKKDGEILYPCQGEIEGIPVTLEHLESFVSQWKPGDTVRYYAYCGRLLEMVYIAKQVLPQQCLDGNADRVIWAEPEINGECWKGTVFIHGWVYEKGWEEPWSMVEMNVTRVSPSIRESVMNGSYQTPTPRVKELSSVEQKTGSVMTGVVGIIVLIGILLIVRRGSQWQ